jgi:hypothetical protein
MGETEGAVVDAATGLQQEINVLARPSHLLLVWTAPGGIDCGTVRSLLISDKGDRP